MKKILILLLLSGTVYAQSVTKKETIDKFLFKTWIADYAMLNGLKVEQMGQMKSLKYAFKADGTYLLNDKTSGTWKFIPQKKRIELYINGTLKSMITTIDHKRIVMVLAPDKAAPKGSKFEIYFKPKKA